MPLDKIKEVSEKLKNEEFTENNLTEKKNKQHYKDFVKQIEFWIEQKEQGRKNEVLKPVKSWEELFQRIQYASVSVYGVALGIKKSNEFRKRLKKIIEAGHIQNEELVFKTIVHEDLSSTIHLVIDLTEEDIIQELKKLEKL